MDSFFWPPQSKTIYVRSTNWSTTICSNKLLRCLCETQRAYKNGCIPGKICCAFFFFETFASHIFPWNNPPLHLSAPASGMMIDQRFQRVRLSAKSCRRHVSLSQTQKDGWKPPRCSRCQHATKMSPTTIRVPFLGSRNVPKCIKLQEGCQKEVNVPDWLVEGSVPNKVLQDWSVQFHSQDWNGLLLLVSLAQLFATVCNCELRPQEETFFWH